MVELIGNGLLLLGGFVVLTAGVGMLRMPDFYTRIHPAGMGDSLGLPLILLGIAVLRGSVDIVTLKLLFLMLFSMVTSSTASHALAKAACVSDLKPLGMVIPRRGRAHLNDPDGVLKNDFHVDAKTYRDKAK